MIAVFTGKQGIFELENGGGLFGKPHVLPVLAIRTTDLRLPPWPAREFNSRAAKAIWDLDGTVLIYASPLLQLS